MTKGFFESQRGLSSKVQILILFSMNMSSVILSFITCVKRNSVLKLRPKNEVQVPVKNQFSLSALVHVTSHYSTNTVEPSCGPFSC